MHLDQWQSLPALEGKPRMGCPNDVVPGYDSWNHLYGDCGRTSRQSNMKLENFDCALKIGKEHHTRSICQKPKEGKISVLLGRI